jgi:predicted dehydrogenase
VIPFVIVSFGFMLGLVVLATGLYRARAAQGWMAAFLVVAAVLLVLEVVLVSNVLGILAGAFLLVGLGSIGRRHARNWAALGLGEVWVCRQAHMPQPEPLGVDVRTFDDLDAALAAGPDVALVTNPTSLHVPTALAAVRAGCHVFVEKPLGASLDGVAELLAEAERRQRHVFVGYNLRFHPGLARARELLLAGTVGRPLSAHAEMGEYLPAWHPWEDYRHAYSARRELGGGPILTFSHELDSLCWLLGRPKRVVGLAAHVSMLEVDTEDVAEIVLQYEGGAVGSVHVDYVLPLPRRYLEIVGEEGIVRWEYDENRLLVYAPVTREWRVEQGRPSYTRNDMYLDELRHVAACVRGEVREPRVDGTQGAAVLVVALAALRSAAEGRAIDLTRDGPGETAAWLNSLAYRPAPLQYPSPTSFVSTAA